MRKIFATCLLPFALCGAAHAAAGDQLFKREVRDGLDIRVMADGQAPAPGQLGREVYRNAGAADSDDLKPYVKTDMYARLGGSITTDWLSGDAKSEFGRAEVKNGYSAQIGIGWNTSDIVRLETGFQYNSIRLGKTYWAESKLGAAAQQIYGMMYFDLTKRYDARGDIIRREYLVPFIGVGIGAGHFAVDDAKVGLGWIDGASGLFAAPRFEAGLNIAVTDFFGVDIAYQYSMYITDGFGWGDNLSGGITGISSITAGFRFNF